MSEKTTTLQFEVTYDDAVTTPLRLAQAFDELFDETLKEGCMLENHCSDVLGTPGVGEVTVKRDD